MALHLDKDHGVNPGLENCFFCNKPKGVILWGHLSPKQRQAMVESGLKSHDTSEAPRTVVLNHEPCQECAELMKKGVILISVREPFDFRHRTHSCGECKHAWVSPVEQSAHTANLSGEKSEECPKCGSRNIHSSRVQDAEDPQNPYRTGGWVVVTDEAITRMVHPAEMAEDILRKRMAFVPDDAWDLIGLPRGDIETEGVDVTGTAG